MNLLSKSKERKLMFEKFTNILGKMQNFANSSISGFQVEFHNTISGLKQLSHFFKYLFQIQTKQSPKILQIWMENSTNQFFCLIRTELSYFGPV